MPGNPQPKLRSFRAETSLMGIANINFVVWSVVMLLIVFAVAWVQPNRPAIWNLFLIAMGFTGAGSLLGFLYASFGEESERFKPVFNLINGVLGGAAITDLTKGGNSLIRGFFWSLAKACGILDGVAIISMVAIAFGAIGFLAMYYNRKLLLNPASAEADRSIASFGQRDAASDALRKFWKPDDRQANPANERKLVDWMNSNGLASMPIALLLYGDAYSVERMKAAKDLGVL